MESKLLLLVLIFGVAFADVVVQFGDKDFDNKIGDHETALIMFYAPWCGHCKKLKPEFEKAAMLLKANDPPVTLAKIDCTEDGKDICSRFGVSGYPTLKIFRNGDLSTEYNGPRDVSGIYRYMRSQVGPASKELPSVAVAEEFLSKKEVGVVYFGKDSELKDAFMKTAEKMRESIKFGHSTTTEVDEKYGHSDSIVLFRPAVLHNKFEPSSVIFDGSADKVAIENFIKNNYHGLVGHRTQDTQGDFAKPLVVAYYSVDYIKNAKGTNYWRNRVLKVAQDFVSDFTFGVSAKDEFQHELNEFGLEYVSGDKPVVCARDATGRKFIMQQEFTMENFELFLNQLKGDELEPYLKSEAIPEQDGPVTVAVAKNFDDVITNNGKDTLIEFYAPWCGHCKKLGPVFDELGTALIDEDVSIVKMDATANDVPSTYNVKGFPTLYWKPKSGSPVPYSGGRELDDFVKFISKEATDELKGWSRSGKAKTIEL